ncbi:HNH endonuclease [Streptomyces sp. NPDC004728]|uniref:HNH endonuclease n=1 Tax=Streptomyces sp. NPDC004728 TaxID=3154289 RepID=UPI0033B193E8
MAAKYSSPRQCGLTDCSRRYKGNGLCELHLMRLKRTGTTDAPARQTLADRFWAKVDKDTPHGCWEWTAVVNEHGYGVMRPAGRRSGPPVKAHRISLELAGIEVAGKFVLHSCDNRRCVNPAHLSVGDHEANVADMMSRQRQALGSRNGVAKLDEDQVSAIRARAAQGDLRRRIAADYAVSPSTISRIVNEKGWRHVS